MKKIMAICAAPALAVPALAQDDRAYPAPGEIVAAAPQGDWIAIPAEDLLVMTLAPDGEGTKREIVIQLMPEPFSQGWVENIRTLARAQWYDGIKVNRVQDNYVVQWGDPGHDNPESGEAETKPLPEGLNKLDECDYAVEFFVGDVVTGRCDWLNYARHRTDPAKQASVGNSRGMNQSPALDAIEAAEAAAEAAETATEAPREKDASQPETQSGKVTDEKKWFEIDAYADSVALIEGWPVALDWHSGVMWPVHCYGMVGVGRGYSPDTGSGAELYTVIGHAPRHLDRNIALVGRVIDGMEHLSSLPRGSGALGFYTEEEADLRTPIRSIRVAAELPKGGSASSSDASGQQKRPQFEYLSTESETFARYAEARANRRDPFFIKPAGGADICNIPVPVRMIDDAEAG